MPFVFGECGHPLRPDMSERTMDGCRVCWLLSHEDIDETYVDDVVKRPWFGPAVQASAGLRFTTDEAYSLALSDREAAAHIYVMDDQTEDGVSGISARRIPIAIVAQREQIRRQYTTANCAEVDRVTGDVRPINQQHALDGWLLASDRRYDSDEPIRYIPSDGVILRPRVVHVPIADADGVVVRWNRLHQARGWSLVDRHHFAYHYGERRTSTDESVGPQLTYTNEREPIRLNPF